MKLALILIALCTLADAQTYPDFSATQVFNSGKVEMPMKVHRSGSSVYVERTATMSTLYATSETTIYNFTTYPDHSHQCVAMNPEQARMIPSPLEMIQGTVVKRTALGTEEMEGHSTQVELVEVIGIDGKTIESKVWRAEDLQGVPVRIESHLDNNVNLNAVYRDIKIATPSVALFATPEKCTPFEKMWQVAEAKVLR